MHIYSTLNDNFLYFIIFLVLQIDAPAVRPHQRLRGHLPVHERSSNPGPGQGAHQVIFLLIQEV